MPRTAESLLRCARCHRREQPDRPSVGPRATGAENERTIDGKRRNAYHIRCSCGHQWWSTTARAKALTKLVDARDKKPRTAVPA